MQKLYFSKIFGVGCIIAALILASSCVSRSVEYDIRAFGAVGSDADVYIVAPVIGNEPLLKALFTAFVPERTALQYLNRTSVLYIGADYGAPPSVTVVSSGSYPVSLGDLLFSKKDGWEKRRSAALNNRTYYSSAVADIVVQEKIAFMCLGGNQRNSAAFLQRIAEPQPPIFPPRFQALSEAGRVGEIGLYARSGGSVVSALLGLEDIELPIRSIELYLKRDINSMYRCSAVFEAIDARAALVVRLLLSHGLNGAFSVQDSSIFVENADITETELITMLQGITSAANIAQPR
ncbi:MULTISPECIES: hypothetical protein [unclassified Treponema]|uniref:hypothetical protein n=1 Tax=unclassified Treponema TaxID=2638727 RepID=UPI00053014F3|nr:MULTISPECIES: hypothetical protein [unclassified Treponema]AIW88589.1 hypothetical protein JO41_01260 [Treponema sp. OMZ 838]